MRCSYGHFQEKQTQIDCGHHGHLIYNALAVHKKCKSIDVRQHQFQSGKKRRSVMDGFFGGRIFS
jgi:hypothetical protein